MQNRLQSRVEREKTWLGVLVVAAALAMNGCAGEVVESDEEEEEEIGEAESELASCSPDGDGGWVCCTRYVCCDSNGNCG